MSPGDRGIHREIGSAKNQLTEKKMIHREIGNPAKSTDRKTKNRKRQTKIVDQKKHNLTQIDRMGIWLQSDALLATEKSKIESYRNRMNLTERK